MKAVISGLCMLCSTATALASDYEPTEGWPYLYYDFTPAIVYYHNMPAAAADINVHLVNNTLHFINGENIMVVNNAQRIDSVVCENKIVLLRKGNLYIEKLAETQHVTIGRSCEADLEAMSNGNGAYGLTTSTAATQNISSFSNHGNIAAQRYIDMKAERSNSRVLPTTVRLCFVIDNNICHATKRGINSILTHDEQKKFGTFLKSNKIKWKDLESLKLVANFLEKEIDHSYESDDE